MKKNNIFLILFLLIFFNSSSYADELDKLFLKLNDAKNYYVAENLEKTGWLYDNLRMQEIGLMWSVIAMLRGYKSAEFDVRKGEKNLRNESISRVQILVKDCVEKKFVGCGN